MLATNLKLTNSTIASNEKIIQGLENEVKQKSEKEKHLKVSQNGVGNNGQCFDFLLW